jgi:uncharacterized protein (TIGR04255 family)
MAEPRHLEHAPIAEAMVDFQTSLPDTFDMGRFQALAEALHDRYPVVEQQTQHQAFLRIGLGVSAADVKEPQLRGYVFRSADRLTIAQFRRDGFTFNRLRPYTSWDELRPEALRLWELYRKTADPPPCARLSLRYINQIEIPIPGADLTDYFILLPGFPADISTPMTEFLTRIVLVDPELNAGATVVLASQVGPNPNLAVIILDIDAYRQVPDGIVHDRVPQALSDLRALKNRIFFGSVTETTLRRYQ